MLRLKAALVLAVCLVAVSEASSYNHETYAVHRKSHHPSWPYGSYGPPPRYSRYYQQHYADYSPYKNAYGHGKPLRHDYGNEGPYVQDDGYRSEKYGYENDYKTEKYPKYHSRY